MRVGVIVTEGHQAEHPPEKLAMECAKSIVEMPTGDEGPRYTQALKLQLAIVDVLTKHHANHQKATQTALETDAAAHFAGGHLHDPGRLLDAAVAEVEAASKGTPWEAEFVKPDIVEQMRLRIGQSLVDAAHVSRLWYAWRHPNDVLAQAYKDDPAGVLILPPVMGV